MVCCPVLHLSSRTGSGLQAKNCLRVPSRRRRKCLMKTTFMVTARGRALLAHRGPQCLLPPENSRAGRGGAGASQPNQRCLWIWGAWLRMLQEANRGRAQVRDPLAAPSIRRVPEPQFVCPALPRLRPEFCAGERDLVPLLFCL